MTYKENLNFCAGCRQTKIIYEGVVKTSYCCQPPRANHFTAGVITDWAGNCWKPPQDNLSNPAGLAEGIDISSCANEFSVDVSDPEGVEFVKVDFSINDPSFAASDCFLLSQSGTTWSGFLIIPTTANAGADTVYWRFWVIDGKSNFSYFSADVEYFYYAPLEC